MIRIEPIFRPKRSEARRLLACLGERYPGGLDWLDRRLDDVEAGRAQAWCASLRHVAMGLAIVTPKGGRRIKLSTLYVAPVARGFGVGGSLLATLAVDWQRRELDEAFVTLDEDDGPTGSFFAEHGFSLLPGMRRAYGARFDNVYAISLATRSIGRPYPEAACPS